MPADRTRMPPVGADPTFTFPSPTRHRLANGLDVRTLEHPGVPVVTFVLQVDGGSGADGAGQEGLAALTADLLDEGTGALSAIDVSEALARIGADYDVDVDPDATLFTLTTLARFAGRGAALLADLVVRPSLRDSDFGRVRQLRLDRLRQITDHPSAVAERGFLRLLYGDHPYGHLAIGSDVSLRALSIDEVAALHAQVFRPSRAILVVAGALSHERLRDLAESAFGGWQASAAAGGPSRQVAAADVEPPPASPTRLAVIDRPGAAQSELRIGHLSARRGTPDYSALLVMNAVLGSQFVSRVNLKLREEKAYTYGARTGFDWRRGPGPFVLQASVHTAATADAIADSLAELAAIRGARPPSEDELTLAKASLTRGYPRGFETPQQVARSVAQLALFGLPDDYFEAFVPKVLSVTEADVTRVAERYLDPSRFTTLVVGDVSAIGGSLQTLGLGAPELFANV